MNDCRTKNGENNHLLFGPSSILFGFSMEHIISS
jgi:hypothetical protein